MYSSKWLGQVLMGLVSDLARAVIDEHVQRHEDRIKHIGKRVGNRMSPIPSRNPTTFQRKRTIVAGVVKYVWH